MISQTQRNVYSLTINLFCFLGDEMFSDTYKIKLIDEVLYEVTGKVSILILCLWEVHVLITILSLKILW